MVEGIAYATVRCAEEVRGWLFVRQGCGTEGLEIIGLLIVAVAAVIVAVALAEHSVSIVMRTLRIIGTAGRAVALVLALFFLSLAAINAAVILLRSRFERA